MATSTEKVYPYALTTLTRVKERLGKPLSEDAFDAVLTRMINAATDYIQQKCGGRQFAKTVWLNEVYTPERGARILNLRNFPIISVESFQYRAGPNSAPSWTSFLVDEYDILNPRPIPGQPGTLWYPDGQLQLYGGLPSMYGNTVRVSYTAGYAIDWPNAGNGTTHLLPADLTDVCENIVIRRFKRRELAGKQSEGLDNASTSWRNAIDQEDQEVIDSYALVPIF